MTYKAIIFDLDGTAIINEYKALPSKRLVSTIQKAQSSFKLCTATGRPSVNAKSLYKALGLVDPCVISAGTEIIDPRSDKILWEYDMEPASVQQVLKVFRDYTYELIVGNEGIGNGGRADTRTLDGRVNVMYLMCCTPNDALKIMEDLNRIPNISASDSTSWLSKHHDIHVTHRQATKEHAVSKLQEMLGVSKEETIGIGDANNDIHLFRAVGLKVAMGNATEALKSHADVVCDSVENDGLAKFIEEKLSLTT